MGGFFLEEDEVSGCWNKWRGSTWGPRGRGARPAPSWPNGGPPGVFLVPDILKYSTKNYILFSGHLENFFWGIFYYKDNSENRQKILFLLYLI